MDRCFGQYLGGIPQFDPMWNPCGPLVAIERQRVSLPQDGFQAGAFYWTKPVPDPQGDTLGWQINKAPARTRLASLQNVCRIGLDCNY
jgi:hypothetical protein